MTRRHIFAPVPVRAITDPRMTGRKLRILAMVAAHDRFSVNGVGCTLSRRALADKLGLDWSNAKRDVRALIRAGYLDETPHPTRPGRVMLAVRYDDAADRDALTGGVVSNPLRGGYQQPPEDSPLKGIEDIAIKPSPTVTRSVQGDFDDDGADDATAFTSPNAGRAGEGGAVPAPERVLAIESAAGFVRQAARYLAAAPHDDAAADAILARLEDIADAHWEGGVAGWALRVLEAAAAADRGLA